MLKQREEYKKFWEEYKKLPTNAKKRQVQKEILFLRKEIKELSNDEKNKKIVKFYKSKLVEYGVLKVLKNECRTSKHYIKKEHESLKNLGFQ